MLNQLEQIKSARSHLLSILNDLSDNQLNWKPDDFTWSIAQVVQHIASVETGSSQVIALGLTQEPNFEPREIPLDQLILDRTKKVEAPERLHPSTEWKTKNQLRQILHTSREKFISTINSIEDQELLEKTSPPLPHPVFGNMSTGQWITATGLHEERHILQIEELKGRITE